MSLVERLRARHCHVKIADREAAADRIEALERALREIAVFHGPIADIARAALKEGE